MDPLDSLYDAALAGDVDAIAKLEMEANTLDQDEQTILHIESRNGNTERVQFIVKEFASKNLLVKLDNQQETALTWAAYLGHTEVVEVLIDAARQLPPSSPNDDADNEVSSFQAFLRQGDKDSDTALHSAVVEGNIDIVKLLVEADPTDPHTQNDDGKTPMFIAVEQGYNDIAELIYTTCTAPSLDGPDGSTVVRVRNPDQVESSGGKHYEIMERDALFAAAISGDVDVIAILEMKADILNEYDETILHIESESGNTEHVRFILSKFVNKDLLGKQNMYKQTALHLAVDNENTGVVEVIIEAARQQLEETSFQAFLRQGDQDNDTALHLAVMEENVDIVKLLVGADPTDTHTQNDDGETPMYIAVEKENNEIVELISKTCTAPSMDGPDGSTVVPDVESPGGTLYKIMDRDDLLDAAIAGDADARARLEMKPDILNKYGETILHIESDSGNAERVGFILREFAKKNLLTKLTLSKHTALHLAIYSGHAEVADVIIEAARRNLPETSFQNFLRQGDEDNDTALHAAVTERNVAIVKLLVEADPTDKHTQNADGKTPMFLAVELEFDDVVEIISTTCTAPSMEGPDGSTALHAAVKKDNHSIEMVEVLIAVAKRLPSSAPENDNTDSNAVTSYQASSASDNDDADDGNDDDDDDADDDGTDDNTDPNQVTSFQASFSDKDNADDGNGDDNNDSTNDHPVVTSFQAFLRRADEDGNTALHIAVTQGNLPTAKLLVESDPSYPGTQNKKSEKPFYIAAERGHVDMLKMMCTTCTSPQFLYGPGGNITALHAFIKNVDEGNNQVIKDVIEMIIDQTKKHKINVAPDDVFYETDEDGCTILEVAVEQNKVAVVNLILDVQHPASKRKDDGAFISLMPVIYKAQEKEKEEYKKIVDLLTERYNEGLKLSKDFKYPVSLISAIKSGKPESVSNLLSDRRAERTMTFVDKLGWTVLHHAVYHESSPIIKLIAEAQKRFKSKSGQQEKAFTPFHLAAQRGLTSIVTLLMQSWQSSSSTYTAVDKNGQNILHLAALQSKKDMIVGILKNCPEEHKKNFVNKRNKDGNTTLHLLFKEGCLIPELLKYKELDLSVKNNEKWIPSDMLYVDDETFNDQVKIKVAIDHIQIDRKTDIFSSSHLSVSTREEKDVKFKKEAQHMIDGKLARMKEDTRAFAECFSDAIAGDPISRAALEIEADTLSEAGETILHVESKKGAIKNVRFIVSKLENKNLLVKLDHQKQTALYVAAHHGHTQVVKALLDAARRNLPFASANDDTLNVPNNEGKTPIYIAAENGFKDVVKEICMTRLPLSLDGPGSSTALHALIQNISPVTEGGSDMIMMIINAAKRRSNENLEEFFGRTDKLGSTVLQLAVEKNCEDAVRLILQEDPAYQPDREIKRNGLMRLIYKAIDNKCSEGIIKLLSKAYEAGITNPDHKEAVPLILAIKKRDEDSVNGLLRGAKHLVSFTEDNGWTPLHYAVYHEFDSVLSSILVAQEEVGHQLVYDSMVQTPFHVAVEYGYASTLVRLMQLWQTLSSASEADNSPYTFVNKDGQNILHLAAAHNGNINGKEMVQGNGKEMVEGILKYCPEKYKDQILNQKDKNDDTPLHLLVSNGCFIPELIKDKGLDIMEKNKSNFTPWEMLYFRNDVVGDQAHIKIAIDDIQTNQTKHSAWNYWAKNTENKTDIWKNIPASKRKMKDVKFDEEKEILVKKKHEEMYKKDLPLFQKRTNTQIIVTALITTVTFTAGFTMPGGLHQSGEDDEGLVLLSRRTAFTAFIISDALALLLSTCSLFLSFLETLYEDYDHLSRLNAASVVLNISSVVMMMVTFSTGTYLVLTHSPFLAITVCLVGSLFFLFVIVLLIKLVYDKYDKKVKTNQD